MSFPASKLLRLQKHINIAMILCLWGEYIHRLQKHDRNNRTTWKVKSHLRPPESTIGMCTSFNRRHFWVRRRTSLFMHQPPSQVNLQHAVTKGANWFQIDCLVKTKTCAGVVVGKRREKKERKRICQLLLRSACRMHAKQKEEISPREWQYSRSKNWTS